MHCTALTADGDVFSNDVIYVTMHLLRLRLLAVNDLTRRFTRLDVKNRRRTIDGLGAGFVGVGRRELW